MLFVNLKKIKFHSEMNLKLGIIILLPLCNYYYNINVFIVAEQN